ncbi:MAG: urea carboxylase-associated family protein [Alphaproteobacteria bacterium]|nr:urea carboxylase-associated family protein [Alphaproteobacteria bacterium]
MKALYEQTVRVNSGTAWEMKKGQRARITFQSIVDFVVFNRGNLSERFDQARTKAQQGKIYVSAGDMLISKLNTPMMTIVEDTFKGTHDLQYGMCSATSYTARWNRRHQSPWKELYAAAGVNSREDLPLWGCYENIMTALQNYPIIPLDIPAPLNIGQHMEIDGKGNLKWALFDKHRELFEPAPHIDLRADMDCVCAASCDPGAGKLGSSKGFSSKPIKVELFDS